jgi:predicted lysophospholipase L1 biosynthesis ABC-type transport system permease subunit
MFTVENLEEELKKYPLVGQLDYLLKSMIRKLDKHLQKGTDVLKKLIVQNLHIGVVESVVIGNN